MSDETNDTTEENPFAQLESALQALTDRQAGRLAVAAAREAVLALRTVVAAEFERCLRDLTDLQAWAEGGQVPAAATRYVELEQLDESADRSKAAAAEAELMTRYWGEIPFLAVPNAIMKLAAGGFDGNADHLAGCAPTVQMFAELFDHRTVVDFAAFEQVAIDHMRKALPETFEGRK